MRDTKAIKAKCEMLRDEMAADFLAHDPASLMDLPDILVGMERVLKILDSIEWELCAVDGLEDTAEPA